MEKIKLREKQRFLLENKVNFLLSNGDFSIISSLVVQLAFCYFQLDLILNDSLYTAWAIISLVVAIIRLAHLRLFHIQKNIINYNHWLNSYRALTFISGSLYGALIFLFFDHVSAAFQVVLMFIIVGVSAASVATHGIDKLTFRLFTLTILITTMTILLFHPVKEYSLLSMLLILFLLVIERSASQMATTMQSNFELTYSMKYRATHDPLVGLFNRSELEQQYESGCNENSHGIAMLFIDLDNFKLLNDKHGHEAGDDALIAIAKIIKTRIRSDDIAARLGGDEFVVWLCLDDILVARRIADEIRIDIESLYIEDQRMTKLSCSIGLAFKFDNDIGFSRMLREADIACYDSKSQGKNTVSSRIIHD